MEKIGLFPGSFNPFTIGHNAIVEQALNVFDKVVIAFGKNSSKVDIDMQEQIQRVKDHFANNPRVEVISYEGLTMDIAKEFNATIIRGLRDDKDFCYEKSIAEINKKVGNVETVFFVSDPNLSYVSSSMVRELKVNGKDISNFIL